MKPTKSNVLVEPIQHSTETVRGIHVPEAHREQQLSIDCIVIAKGPTASDEILVGGRVLIERFKGTEVHRGKKVFKLIPSTEVLALLE